MRHRVPEWYRNAKLGIMVHWGVPTVPAYAPVEHGGLVDILREHDWPFYFRNNPYAEWYLNSIRIPDSPAQRYHRAHYGSHTSYERIARRFNEDIDRWDPTEWAELFREAGARYVVMVGKHHDGFLMWPSERPPVSESFVAKRDVLGELASAVRTAGMKYGLYYSGLLDWTVQHRPVTDFGDLLLAPTPREYEAYVDAHFRELIARYEPDVLWNDIGLPAGISRRKLFSHYRSAVPEGVLNDRWRQTGGVARRLLGTGFGRRFAAEAARKAIVRGETSSGSGDVATVEYAAKTVLRKRPWELVRGLGNSFAWNAAEPEEHYLGATELIHTLADVVSKNGNLLLNVSPQADGSIPAIERRALSGLAEWLRDHGDAIYGTRPWHIAEATCPDGLPLRFTANANALFVIALGRPRLLSLTIPSLDLKRIPRPKAGESGFEFAVRILGCERPIDWRREGEAIVVDIPGSFVPGEAMVVRLGWQRIEEPASGFYTDVI